MSNEIKHAIKPEFKSIETKGSPSNDYYGCQRAVASGQTEPRSAEPTVGYNILMKKSELFDIIKEQEQLMSRFNQLNDLKMKKIQELQLLEGGAGNGNIA